MNTRWLLAAFVVGVTVGIVATRVVLRAPAGVETSAINTFEVPRDRAAAVPVIEGPTVAVPRVEIPEVSVEPARAALAATGAAQVGPQVVIADAAVERIDAGEVFNEQFAQQTTAGFENTLGNAHRALERETRDDGWAYSMEAELQNSMVNEVSTGAFRAEHIECRATLCELRLSGTAEQAAAIKRWGDSLGAQPFGQRLYLRHGSTISNGERVDSMMIFTRPPRR